VGRLVVSERAARRSAMIQPDVPEKRLPVTRREDLGSRLRKRSVDPFLVHREQSLALAACVPSAFCSRFAGRISTAKNHWKPGAEQEYPGAGNRKSPNRGKVIGLHLPGDVMDIHLSVRPRGKVVHSPFGSRVEPSIAALLTQGERTAEDGPWSRFVEALRGHTGGGRKANRHDPIRPRRCGRAGVPGHRIGAAPRSDIP